MHVDESIDWLIDGRVDKNISPLDRGFSYGDGVFRTFPIVSFKILFWSKHFQKLKHDCNALGIICPDEEILLSDINSLLTRHDAPDATIKVIISRGKSQRGYALPAIAHPTRIVIKFNPVAYPEKHYSDGVNIRLCSTRLSVQPQLAGIKHLNRLENVLARMEWTSTEIFDGLLMDTQNNVIECTMSNLFIRNKDTLTTPDLSGSGVAGVTRDSVIELAPSLGYSIQVKHIRLEEIYAADEFIITNSLFGAWQVRAFENQRWPVGYLAAQLRGVLMANDANPV